MKKGSNKNIRESFDIYSVSYLIQIIFAILAYFRIDKIIDELIKSVTEFSMYDEELTNQMVSTYTGTSGIVIVALLISVALIFSIIGFFVVINKKEKNHKVLLITLSAVSIYLSSGVISSLYAVFAIVTLILSIKIQGNKLSKEEKEELKKKREIKKFKAHKTTKEVVIKSLIMIALYFILMFVPTTELLFDASPYVHSSISSLILIFAAIGLFYKEYKQMWSAFIKKPKNSVRYIFKNYGKMLLIYFPFAIIISLAFGTSSNQDTLNSLNLVFVFLLSVFYAPLVEETVFRGAIRKIIKNDVVFIIISGLLFGIVHTIGQEASILYTVAESIPYAVIGSYFAYIYTKNGNMMYNISLHSLHNFICCIIMFITGL